MFQSDGSPIGYGVKWSYDKDMSYLGNSVCKLINCKELYQYTITSQEAMNHIIDTLSDEETVIDSNDMIGIIKTFIGESGSISLPLAFQKIVEHYGWNVSSYIKFLKTLGWTLALIDASDTIRARIASGEISTFNDLVNECRDSNESMIITVLELEISKIPENTDTHVYMSKDNNQQVSNRLNRNFNPDLRNLYTSSDYFDGRLNYIYSSDEIDFVIHSYFEQSYGFLPW